jgi:hypothetical protein
MAYLRLRTALLGLLLAGTVAFGFQSKKEKQEELTKRSVQGAVRDAQDNLVTGAVVQLKNTKTLQVRSYVTKEDGGYRFNGLSRDVDFELKAEFQGMVSSNKTLSVFDDRRLAIINLKLESKK